MNRNHYTGFTLIELLIVIAIIGILASIVMASLSDSRREARNAAVITQLAEYEKALALHFAEYGQYPTPASPAMYNRRYCLGEGSHSSGCWQGTVSTEGPLTSALVPAYMSRTPGFDQGNLGSPAYMSCIGTTAVTPNDDRDNPNVCGPNRFSLLFVLEGTDEDCRRAVQVDSSFASSEGEYTLCRLNLP